MGPSRGINRINLLPIANYIVLGKNRFYSAAQIRRYKEFYVGLSIGEQESYFENEDFNNSSKFILSN